MVEHYQVIQAGSLGELAQQVKALINLGWQPLGGVSSWVNEVRDGYSNTFKEVWFLQAMVK